MKKFDSTWFWLFLALQIGIGSTIGPAMPGPKPGTWENWILAVKSDGKKGLPGRPDQKPLSAPLPAWVDCHLSHYMDIPSTQSRPKIFKKITLQSDTKLCKGSLENISQ